MRRTAAAGLVLSFLLAACSDSTRPPMPSPASPPLVSTAPAGSLDAQVTSLIHTLFPTGLDTAASARWTALKAKYADGQTKASQLAVAKKMLVDLTTWVQQKTPQMNTPGNGLTQQAAAAQLVLYMADYVYFGPGFTPQTFPPGADATVGIVSPTTATTIVTPTTHAGLSLGAGSVNDQTIVVIRQNSTYYPANCTGPLSTKYCQYPLFYQFDEFPHVRLNKVAQFSVCHVRGDTPRAPLADHDRFRLAHTLPANPADYTPGATQVDGIEILPLIHQSFVNCDAGDVYQPPPSLNRIGMMLWRGRRMVRELASAVGKLVSPRAALAIDQGGGGDALSFSDFNDVDPQSQPDNAVQNLQVPSSGFAGDALTVSFTVRNVGTAAATTATAVVRLVPTQGAPVDLASLAVNALVPQATQAFSSQVTIPESTSPGGYSIEVDVSASSGLAEIDLTNNTASSAITIAAHPLVLSPAAPSLVPGSTQSFSVTSGGAAPYAWSVNGIAGGSAATGTIDSNGGYTAPWTVPQTGAVTVCAARQVNPGSSGCTSVTITAPGDVVVFNDINTFDQQNGGTLAGNVQLWKNLATQLVGTGPQAAGITVWIHRGHGTRCDLCLDQTGQWQQFETTLAGLGYTVQDVDDATGVLTAIPASVRLVVLVMPQVNYSIAEINGFRRFVNAGGRLMFVGEWGNYYNSLGPGIAVENAFLSGMGAGTVNIGGNYDCPATLSGPEIHTYPITTGISQLGVFCVSALTLGAGDVPLLSDAANVNIAAVVAVDRAPLSPVIAARIPSFTRGVIRHTDLAPGTTLTSTGVETTTPVAPTRAPRRP